ncbi:hypothetical protein Sp245p_35095 (plasmid) [Azospirillum baldaniorum]|uniref:Uncharacterized protein n=1 Tax=Azospirillum baldaniorum TaxID=1064539 RepID=A0A9P1NRV1_9PROT|nr:hypothetical protein Sp245p_35095 [Azospirillum baldaniorum]CCD03483.1 exported protein of unknown function [Azospirillum baldaniorum]
MKRHTVRPLFVIIVLTSVHRCVAGVIINFLNRLLSGLAPSDPKLFIGIYAYLSFDQLHDTFSTFTRSQAIQRCRKIDDRNYLLVLPTTLVKPHQGMCQRMCRLRAPGRSGDIDDGVQNVTNYGEMIRKFASKDFPFIRIQPLASWGMKFTAAKRINFSILERKFMKDTNNAVIHQIHLA